MKKNIFLLGLTSFINDIASKMILPILPLFIKDIGGTGVAIGLIAGLGESIASILKMLGGYWSDRIRMRKPFLFFGYTISAIAKILFTIVVKWPHVLILRGIERFGKGVRSAPRDALLALSTNMKNRGRGFGIHRAMDSGGAVVGSILAFLLFWYAGFSFRNIFLAAGIIAFMSLIPILFLKERPDNPDKIGDKRFRVEFKRLSKRLRVFIAITTLFAFGNFSYMFFILKGEGYFEGRLAIGIPILLYTIFTFSYTIFSIPSGVISDRIGRRKVLLIGYSIFGLVCLGFIIFKSTLLLIILFIILGINYALVNANERAFVSDLSPKDMRGTALGTFYMATSIMALPAGLFAGYIWDINTNYTFLFGLIIALIVVILLFNFKDQEENL